MATFLWLYIDGYPEQRIKNVLLKRDLATLYTTTISSNDNGINDKDGFVQWDSNSAFSTLQPGVYKTNKTMKR